MRSRSNVVLLHVACCFVQRGACAASCAFRAILLGSARCCFGIARCLFAAAVAAHIGQVQNTATVVEARGGDVHLRVLRAKRNHDCAIKSCIRRGACVRCRAHIVVVLVVIGLGLAAARLRLGQERRARPARLCCDPYNMQNTTCHVQQAKCTMQHAACAISSLLYAMVSVVGTHCRSSRSRASSTARTSGGSKSSPSSS